MALTRIYADLDSIGVLDELASRHGITLSEVTAHLDAGAVALSNDRSVTDRVNPAADEVPVMYFTDGSWVWSAEIVKYVTSYRMGLPEEFLSHIAARRGEGRPVEVQASELQEARELLMQ